MKKITSAQYFEDLTVLFPSLKKEIDGLEALNHLKMEVFSRYTNLQIQKRNRKELLRCLNFQESMLETMPNEIENCLYVSYIESLLLGEDAFVMKKKVNLMPSKFRQKYEEYAKYYGSLGEKNSEKL
jgi:hypothetical protein